MLAALLVVALAADGGVPADIYKVPAGASIDLHDGDGPFNLPEGFFFPQPAFVAVNKELVRLQEIERTPPKTAVVGVPVQGYLILAGIVAVVFFGGGVAVGAFVSSQGHK